MSPRVSIILPTYNNQNTILKSVSSILNQTYFDFELIIMNDGSTDETEKLLQGISDKRLILISSPVNTGLPKRLNEGLKMAQGEYIARMDADDIAFPSRIQKQVDFLDINSDVDLCATQAIIFDCHLQIIGRLPYFNTHSEIIAHPWNNIPLPHPTWMMRRKWVMKYQYAVPEVWRAEDQDLLLRSYTKSKFATLPEILLCYYQGSFDYQKTSIARRNLFLAQFTYFKRARQYHYAFLSFSVFLLKSIYDSVRFIMTKTGKYSIKSKSLNIPVAKMDEAKSLIDNQDGLIKDKT